jgi:F0F1-type ATP synthase delta subunit
MSKYKAKDYAEALSDVLSEKATDLESKKKASNFLKLLEKNGDMRKAKEIINLTETIFFKKTGRKKIVLESARKLNESQRKGLKLLETAGDITEERINKNLIAGVKIIINGNKQFDGSLQRKLQNIF